MQDVTVAPRSAFLHNVAVDAQPNATGDGFLPYELAWHFFTRSKNISFGLFRRRSRLQTSASGGLSAAPRVASAISLGSAPSRRTSDASDRSRPSSAKRQHSTAPSTESRSDSVRAAPLSRQHSTTSAGGSSASSTTAASASASASADAGARPASFGAASVLASAKAALRVPPLTTRTSDASVTDQNAESYHQPASAPRGAKNNPERKLTIDPDLEEVIPIAHYPSSKDVIKGSYLVDEPAVYVLIFDNSYSVKQSKRLSFVVSVRCVAPASYETPLPKQIIAGWILKKASRKMQGFQKRWATIDSNGLFTYYKAPSGYKHGAVQIRRSMVSINHDHKTFDVDSGESLFHLKAYNSVDFTKWAEAFQLFCSAQIPPGGYSNAMPSSSKMSGEEDVGGSNSAGATNGSVVNRDNIQEVAEEHVTDLSNEKSRPGTEGSQSRKFPTETIIQRQREALALEAGISEAQKANATLLLTVGNAVAALKTAINSFEETLPSIIDSNGGSGSTSKAIVENLHNTISPTVAEVSAQTALLLQKFRDYVVAITTQRDIMSDNVKACLSQIVSSPDGLQLLGADPNLLRRAPWVLNDRRRVSIEYAGSPSMSTFSLAARRLSGLTSPESVFSSDVFFDAVQGDDFLSSLGTFSIGSNGGVSNIALGQSILANKVLEQAITNEESTKEDEGEDEEGEDYEEEDEMILDDEEIHSARVSSTAKDGKQTSGVSYSSSSDRGNLLVPPSPGSQSPQLRSPDPQVIAENTGIGYGRVTLPAPMIPVGNLSLLSLLRGGKGGSMSMPIVLNEPLSLLQKMCEELEYSELLDSAASTKISCEKRAALVAAFAVSGYACTILRSGRKPFNPMLGETFEFYDPSKGWRYFAEKVCHHPAIMASYAEGGLSINNEGVVCDGNVKYTPKWIMYQESEVVSKFWGKSLELIPDGIIHLEFPELGLHYIWRKVTTCMRDVLSSTRYLEHYGTMLITERNKAECSASVTFKESSYFSGSKNEITGNVQKDGKRVYGIAGYWPNSISIYLDSKPDTQEVIWRSNAFPPNAPDMYGFTLLTVRLNEVPPKSHGQFKLLPKTDSRFRTDQRMYENGQLNEAEQEKARLEQKQREIRKDSTWVPRWFYSVSGGDTGGKKTTEIKSWKYGGKYWESRGNFPEEVNNWELW